MLGFRSTATCGVCFGALVVACGGGGGGNAGSGGDDHDAGPSLDSGVDGGDAALGTDASEGDSSTTDSGGVDSAADAALGPHAAQPQVVNLGGTVLTSPKVQLIVYTEDPMATDADSAVTELSQTSTWGVQTSEYGVGALTKLPTIQIGGALPATLDDDSGNISPFEQTLVTNTTGASPIWGTADSSTIYAFLIPATTDLEAGGACCTDFFGYHYEVPIAGGTPISYAVICECTDPPPTPLENVTTTISHELVESATDPFPSSSPAYTGTDNNDVIWSDATGGEIADMCEFNADENYLPPGSTYMVQRSWSNAAAAAGTNPCVPGPAVPYFDSMAVLTDTITLSNYGSPTPTRAVQIPVGSSKTIDVQLFSSTPTSAPWTVTAYDLNDYLGNTANTTVSLDTSTGSNGDVIHLTIHVTSTDTDLGGEGFVLVSDLGTAENLSFGAVGN
jgi:hypothetical protein